MVATGTALLVAGIVGAAGSVASAQRQASAAKTAARAQSKATADAQQLERDAEAENRRQFDVTTAQNEQRWNTEQDRDQQRYELSRNDALRSEAQQNARWTYDNKRRATTRAAGKAAVEALAKDAGLTLRETEPPPDMAQGWDANSLTPPKTTPGFTRPPLIDPNDPRVTGGVDRRNLASLGGGY